jgi:uncharacterized membrane protein YqaE (UPF0057 family)
MGKNQLTETKRKADVDLIIIVFVTLIVLGLAMALQKQFVTFVNSKSINILLRTVVSALIQFGIAGLGITIVSIFRKESFLSYGLKRKGALLSIILCVLCFIPNIVFGLVSGQITSYLPFQQVWFTKEVLSSDFPVNIIGMTLITVAWGFFEGFNYVVISDKINTRYPSKNRWVNWGAISSAILCILIHGAVGVTMESIIEMFTIIIIIYGMLMVKEFTSNAWGCVFIFVFLWNAF